MKNILKIEELFMLSLGAYLFSSLQLSWWWFIGFILVPDISMLAYLLSPKFGAFAYNIFHHKGIAIVIYLLGVYFQNELVQFSGLILFSHASMDRIFGYGLKHNNSFNNTHLGIIGKK